MRSVSPARKHTLAVVLVGVLGLLLVVVFVGFAGSRIRESGRRSADRVGVETGHALRALVLRGFAEARSAYGSQAWATEGLSPATAKAWRLVAPRIPWEILRIGGVSGFSVRGPDGRLVWSKDPVEPGGPDPIPSEGNSIHRVLDPEGQWVGFGFRFPEEGTAAESVLISAYADLAGDRTARDDLTRLLTFGLVGLAVTIYLLAAVTILINRAQARLQQREREKSARLRAIGEVAGGIAHEVRNPLNAISLSVQYMQKLEEKGVRGPGGAEYARVHLELGKIRKVVDSFVRFARTRDMVLAPLDAVDLMTAAYQRFQHQLESQGVQVAWTIDGATQLQGDREKLLEVFAAVIQNAVESMNGQAERELRVRVQGRGRSGVRIVVRDNGVVSQESQLASIFEPSFSARDTAMGMGMTVAKTFVESHGGTIQAAVAQGGGCAVTIDLPRRVS